MKKVGIIDIGSNSIRLVLVKIGENGSYKIFNDIKESVRLGLGMDKDLKLRQDRIEKAISTLKIFKKVCDITNIDEIIPVATAAVRKAKNKNLFLSRVKSEVGISIRVLSGDEEAFFAYLGVINSIDIDHGIIIDIGGGSTELILVKDRKISQSISLPFGSINLTQTFELADAIKDENINNLEAFLLDRFSKIPWLSDVKDYPLIGVGGTIRNISNIVQKSTNYPLDITHNFIMDKKQIDNVYKLVKEKKLPQRKKIKGLSKDRADVFVGAVGAIWKLIEYCKINDIIISGNGIREGIIYDYINKNIKAVDNVVDFSLNNIMDKYDLNIYHAHHIHKITKSLFHQLLGKEEYTVDIYKIIKTASLLHDSGININFYNHPQHSFYMILNSGINGLTHKELLMSAFIASSHRNKKSKVKWVRYKSIIDKKEVEIIRKVGTLLRIAESLDICFNSSVKDIECLINNDEVIIKTISTSKTDVEIKHALSASSQFKKIFKKKLSII